ncbi:MAG: A24 family peptidase [Candidatus Micrarchaeota archaeon]
MQFELLRIAFVLVGTGAAAVQDAKTSYIDDRITGSMIVLGAVLNLLENDQSFWWSAFGIAFVIAVAGYAMYRLGQFGGGDVLLFLGLQLLLPFYPSGVFNAAFPSEFYVYPFVLSVFLAASYFSVLGSGAWYAWRIVEKKIALPRKDFFIFVVLSAASIGFWFVIPLGFMQKAFFTCLFIPGLFLMVFKKQITDKLVVRKIPIKEIEDEDILAIDKLPKRLVAKYGLERVLTKKQVGLLKKIRRDTKRKLFPVCKELPRFGPYILAGLIASLLVRDLFLWVLLA